MKKFFIFLTLVSFCFLGRGSLAAFPERTIGVIYSSDIAHYEKIHKSVVENLQALGVYTKRVKFIEQRPYPDVVSWANAARKLIAYDAEIILTYGAGAAKEALDETASIPVVYASVYANASDMYKKKNAYGCSYRVSMASLIRYARKAKAIKNIAAVYSPYEDDSIEQYESIKEICRALSIKVIGIPVKSSRDLDMMLKLKLFDVVFITGSALVNFEIDRIYEICMKKDVPIISIFEGTEEHSLMTIAADTEMQGMEVAKILKALLKGKKPSPKKTTVSRAKVYFNLRLTSALGLRIPVELVTGAEKVIR